MLTYFIGNVSSEILSCRDSLKEMTPLESLATVSVGIKVKFPMRGSTAECVLNSSSGSSALYLRPGKSRKCGSRYEGPTAECDPSRGFRTS